MTHRSEMACSAVFFLSLTACVCAGAQTAPPSSDDIIARMARAQIENASRMFPYVVTRDYKLFEGDNPEQLKSHMIARITVAPPDSKKYTIENATGSELAERIVRKTLDGEMAFTKDSSSAGITRENYDFLFVGGDDLSGKPCYVLRLFPKRKSKSLLRGTIWVDAKTYLIDRIDGEPAKTPSWWVSNLRVHFLYGFVGPMWVQTASEATANVRIIGRSSLVWQDVSFQTGDGMPGASLARAIVLMQEPIAEGSR
jgi:hypothetical protein